MDAEAAETALKRWREAHDARDQLVRDAHAAGVSIKRIHSLTGLSRTTLYLILDEQRGPKNQ